MLLFLTSALRGGGPGRALCTPTFHGLSDGPFRRIPFRLRPIRHTYKDVLLFGDERQLLATATELLQHPTKKKKKSFWTIYSKRAKASLFILSPGATALILKSFDAHREDTGIYVAAAAALPSKIKEADGKALLIFTEIFSARLKQQQDQEQHIFKAIVQQIPHSIHQLSCSEVLRILRALNVVAFSDLLLCRMFARKLQTYSTTLDHKDVAAAASAFAAQNFRSVSLYNVLKEQALQQQAFYDLSSLYELLNGFYQNAVVYDELLQGFSTRLLQFKDNFSSKQRRVIGQMIADSHLPLPELREEFCKPGD